MKKRRITIAAKTTKAIADMEKMWSFVDKAKAEFGGVQARPPICFTAYEYSERYGIGYDAARAHLRRMTQAGKFRAIRIYAPDAQGRNVATNAYIPV